MLRADPYVLSASASGMSITMEAKMRVLKLYETGMSSIQIAEALGYDCDILAAQRMKKIVGITRKEVASSRGLHEGYPSESMMKEAICDEGMIIVAEQGAVIAAMILNIYPFGTET